jgi:glycosyltransferase involved in cell wall biosynthesis
LIEACKLLVEKDIENFSLDIIGDGEEKENLEHLTRRLRLQQYVTFLGAKNHDEIINEILPNTEILINPSLQEGLPTTVLE